MTGQVNLSLTDNSDVESETIIYRARSGNSLSLFDAAGANTTLYSDTSIIDARSYDYAISMGNAAGESSLSSTKSIEIPLSTPSDLTLSQSGGSVLLDWTRHDDNPNGEWHVFRDGNQIATISDASTTTYTNDTVNDDATYDYYVRRKVNGKTAETATKTITTYLDAARSVTSYISSITTTSQTMIDITAPTQSHSEPITTSSARTISYARSVSSHASTMTSDAARDVGFPRSVTSHSDVISSSSVRSISFSRSSTVGGNGVCIAYGDPTDALDGTPELTIEWDDDRRAYVSQWLDAASLFDPDERDFVVLPDGAITEDGLIVTIEHSEMDDLGTARVLDNNMTNVIELDAHARGGEIRFVFEDIGIDDHLDCVEFGFAHG